MKHSSSFQTPPPSRVALERRLQLALSAGRMAVWQRDLVSREDWWSPEMFALHGMPPREKPPTDYLALVHEDDRQRVRQVMKEVTRVCIEHSVEYRVRWPHGQVHWLQSSGTTICGTDGEPSDVIGITVDIDRHKEDEASLQFLAQASAELAALTDYPSTMQRIARLAVPHFADWCAVDMLDAAGRLQRVAVAHVDPEKVRMALEVHERFPPDARAAGGLWQVIRALRPEWAPVVTEEMMRDAGLNEGYIRAVGRLGVHSYISVPVVAHGEALGAITFVTSESRREFGQRDLTVATDLAARAAVAIQNAELMQELRHSDAAKELFLATLAHELRNPLAPIVNSLALLRGSPDRPEVLARVLPVMERQAHHLGRLVDDLLDLARINSGKIELRRERVELRDLLHGVVDASRPSIDGKQHRLALSLPGEPLLVLGDPVRLAQVLTNLVDNAAKYTPPGGRIEVGARALDDRVEVWVSDDGDGIPPELLPRIFELFTQAARPGEPRHQGLGIGLYLVKRLVQMHGGEVDARSTGPGQGTCFSIRLPRLAAAEAEAPVHASAGHAARPLRLLVVDDNADAADTLAQLLEIHGHEVRTAYSAGQALALLGEFMPQILLLDIGLPDMNGYELARRVRAVMGPQARLVALTGWGQAEDKRRARQAGFDDHWTKPVDPSRLQQLLEQTDSSAQP